MPSAPSSARLVTSSRELRQQPVELFDRISHLAAKLSAGHVSEMYCDEIKVEIDDLIRQALRDFDVPLPS